MNAYSQFLQGKGSGPTAEQVAAVQSFDLSADVARARYLARLDELSAALISIPVGRSGALPLNQRTP